MPSPLTLVGTKYVDAEVYEPRELGGPLLTLHGLSGDGFENIDLTVRRGEIVALTGLAGCGASELLQTVFGAMPVGGGEILRGRQACRRPLGQVHEKRRGYAACQPQGKLRCAGYEHSGKLLSGGA